jgi:hypothetical protein
LRFRPLCSQPTFLFFFDIFLQEIKTKTEKLLKK